VTDRLPAAAEFKDHFSDAPDAYARHRPRYPAALFDALAALCRQRERAWDCATGNGQAAIALSRLFEDVVATDASNRQIEAAMAHDRVRYAVAPAERSGLPGACVDLVTVGQALHWFEQRAFFAEVERVVKPGGILAAWCYQLAFVNTEVDKIVYRLYEDIVGPFWPPERAIVEAGYDGLPMPGAEVVLPEFGMQLDWHANDMLGYLGTWSACKRYAAAHEENPVTIIESELKSAWGDSARVVRWPLKIRACRL